MGGLKIHCADRKTCLKKFGDLCIEDLCALAQIIRELWNKKDMQSHREPETLPRTR